MATDRHTRSANRAARGARAALVLFLLLAAAAFMFAPSAAATSDDTAARTVAQGEAAHATPGEAEHESAEPLWKTLARVFNFAVLVGVLVYFLRAPIASYLARRSTEIRSELTKAAETREAATRELALVEQKMAALPGDIEALKARGADEIAAEEARIARAAETERERLLEQARREIDLQVRTAERDLTRHAAELAVGLASERIKRNITDADQDRLVDRYLGQVGK